MAYDIGFMPPDVTTDIDNSGLTGYGFSDNGFEATRRDSSHIGVELIRAGINRSAINDSYIDSLYERTPGVDVNAGLDDYVEESLSRLAAEGDNNTSTNEQIYGQWTRGKDGVLRRTEGARTFDNVYQRMNGDRNEIYNRSGFDHANEVTYMLTDPWVTGRPVDPQDENPLTRNAIFRQEAQKRLQYQKTLLIPDKPIRDVMAPGLGYRTANPKEWRELVNDTQRRMYYNHTRPDGTIMDVFQVQPKSAFVPVLPTTNVSRTEDSYRATDTVKSQAANQVILPRQWQASITTPTIAATETTTNQGSAFINAAGARRENTSSFVPDLAADPLVRNQQAMRILKKTMNDTVIDMSEAPDQVGVAGRRNLRVPVKPRGDQMTDMAQINETTNAMRTQLSNISTAHATKMAVANTFNENDVYANTRNLAVIVRQGDKLQTMSTILASESSVVSSRASRRAAAAKLTNVSDSVTGDSLSTAGSVKARLATRRWDHDAVNTMPQQDGFQSRANMLVTRPTHAPVTAQETFTNGIQEVTNQPVNQRILGYDRAKFIYSPM